MSPGPEPPGSGGLRRKRVRSARLFLLPALLVVLLVGAWPLLRTVGLGFTDAALWNPHGARFVGLANYLERQDGEWYGVLADPDWWRAVLNTLLFAGVSVAIETLLGLAVALVLHARFRGRGLVRAAVLVPWAVPTIVSAKIWAWMLHDQSGIVNRGLLALGLLDRPLAWTAEPGLALASVILADVWKATPFLALLLLAALQMLPKSLYEAAKVDGLGPVRTFFKITLPLIRPALAVAVLFRLLDALRIFDLIYALTSNSRDTMTMSVYVRQQLVDFQQLGYGSAASALLVLVVGLCTVLFIMAARVRLAEEA